jgi:hypothetical protein
VSEIEVLMIELARATVALKSSLYRRDDFASTTPEGTDGPRTTIHTCAVCGRSAAGQGAEVRPQVRLRSRKAAKGAEGSPGCLARGVCGEAGPGKEPNPMRRPGA